MDEFNYLIDFLMPEKMPEPENESLECKKSQIDKLIVMDDVSGLADKGEDSPIFSLSLEDMALRVCTYFI